MANITIEENPKINGYNVGDFDRRPWGFWLATDVNSGYCEKVIVVAPGKILSLQSHRMRHETWTVLDGTLNTIIDGAFSTLKVGQTIEVPVGSLHCMANLGERPCIIKERQTGVCRESDIVRYFDANGRPTATADDAQIAASVDLYLAVLKQMKEKDRQYA